MSIYITEKGAIKPAVRKDIKLQIENYLIANTDLRLGANGEFYMPIEENGIEVAWAVLPIKITTVDPKQKKSKKVKKHKNVEVVEIPNLFE